MNRQAFVRKECVCGHADSSHTIRGVECRFCECQSFQLCQTVDIARAADAVATTVEEGTADPSRKKLRKLRNLALAAGTETP